MTTNPQKKPASPAPSNPMNQPLSITLGGKGATPSVNDNQQPAGFGRDVVMESAEGSSQGVKKPQVINQSNQCVEDVEVNGEIPQARFGHTVTIVAKQKVVLFGGATGDTGKYSMTGETFMFNIVNKQWTKLQVKGVPPSPRAAHSSTNVEQMQMVVYAGATGGGSLASDDLYLLDMRNGEAMAQWMIVPVVGSTPGRRYGHTIIFSKPYLLVFGGNTGQEPINDVWCLSVERAPFSWNKLDCGKEQPPPRVYHSSALCLTGSATGMMVSFGGRTTDQSSLADTWGLRRHRDGRWDWVKAPYKAETAPTPRYQHSTLFLGPLMIVMGGRTNTVGEDVPMEVYDTESSEWYKFNAVQRFRHTCWQVEGAVYVHGGFEHDNPNIPINAISRIDSNKLFLNFPNLQSKISPKSAKPDADKNKDKKKKNQNIYQIGETQEFKLANQAHIAMQPTNYGQMDAPAEDFSLLVRKISIDKLQEEPKKLGPNVKAPMIQKNPYDSLFSMFIQELLQPKEGQKQMVPLSPFTLKKEQIVELINECTNILQAQPIVVKTLKPPIKVFGNIHGDYIDLMRFLDIWGAPSEAGDISGYDYLFLGNYVDKGSQSLEVICLLMALKLKYPRQIFMLRGNHEDRNVNKYLGLGQECARRFLEDINDPNSIFQKLNDMFEYMPLAAIINDKGSNNKVFCVHAGVGSTVQKIEDIDKITRPLKITLGQINNETQQAAMELLWSDPATSDEIVGVQPNLVRDPLKQNNMTLFSADLIEKFLKVNQLQILIRGNQICPDGMDRFANGQCITINSCTNYCGTHNNDAAFLVVQKKLVISPKIIKPSQQGCQWLQIVDIPDTANSSVKRPTTPPKERNLKAD